MLHFYRVFLLVLLWGLSLFSSFSQKKTVLHLDEMIFATANASNDIDSAINHGINSFHFNIIEKEHSFLLNSPTQSLDISSKLNTLNKALQSKQLTAPKIIFSGEYDTPSLKSFLRETYDSQILFADWNTWPTTDSMAVFNTKIICFFSDKISKLLNDTTQISQSYHGRFSSNPEGKMLLFESNSTQNDSLAKACIKQWMLTGRIPNFLLVEPHEYKKAQNDAAWLNQLRRFRGEITYQGKILNEIYWKQLPGTVTSGQFSFPVFDTALVLSPYKNGYLITPGEIIHHSGMEDVVRPFVSYDTHLNKMLIYHLQFEKDAKNSVEPQEKNIIENGIRWAQDEQRRNVVLFDTTNSFIDYSKENGLNFNTPISVSLWLKPQRLNHFMGIIGIGTSFSLKLQNGMPDFTTAQIKDHIEKTPLELNKWTHVGFVFNPGASLDFYINGKKVKSMQASDIEESKQSLIVGNNIWGEQYYGLIDELMIWDRGLSENEFGLLYQNQIHPQKRSNFLFLLIIPVLALLAFLFFRKRKNRGSISEYKLFAEKQTPDVKKSLTNGIEVFGNFNVISIKSANITKLFSPLVKQLLSYFILRTAFSDNGISTKELNDIFWPGFSKEQAKDNRGTNIKKLRILLKQLPGVQIIFRDRRWFFESTNEAVIDLFEYVKFRNEITSALKQGTVETDSIHSFLILLKKGNILQDLETEWLDAFKSKLTQEILTLLSEICSKNAGNKTLNIKLAKTMLLFDNLNEEALTALVVNLIELGNHGLAKQSYEEFAKRYETLYSEKFPLRYHDLQKPKHI